MSAQGGWRCGRAGPGSASVTATWTSWPPRSSAESWAAVQHWPYRRLDILGQQRGHSGMAPLSATAPSPSCPLAHRGLLTSRTAPNPLPSSAPVSAGVVDLYQHHAVRCRWGRALDPPTPVSSLCCSLHWVPAGEWRFRLHWASGGGGTRGVGAPVCHCLGPA